MELHELQSMYKRLTNKTRKTAQDKENIDTLESLIFDALEEELDKTGDLCSYNQKA